MQRNLPSLSALRAFECCVRLGSMRRAAAELCVSHTVLSRHLRNLESVVGTQLIHIGARGIEPTEDGARYHRQVSQALHLIADATEELRPLGKRGEIRIWCATGLATRWLTRRLPRLSAVLPAVEIVLTPTDRIPSFGRRDADFEIGYGLRPPEPGARQEQLVLPRMFPVASPEFQVAHGPFRQAADLAGQPLLHEGSRQQWRQWLLAAGLSDVPPLQGPRLSYADVAIEAALQGQGIALANTLLIADDIEAGRLVEVLPSRVTLEPYVIRSSVDRWDDHAIRLLRGWLQSELAACVEGRI